MNKNSIWKWLILIGPGRVVRCAVVWPPKEKITLGLDLQGGTSFVLQVDTEELDEDAKEDAPERALEVIRNRVDHLGGTEPIIYLEPHTKRIVVQIPGMKPEERERARRQPAAGRLPRVQARPQGQRRTGRGTPQRASAPPGYKVVNVTGRNQRWLQRDPGEDPEGATEESISEDRSAASRPRRNHDLMLMKEERRRPGRLRAGLRRAAREKLTGENLTDAGVQQDHGTLGARATWSPWSSMRRAAAASPS